MKKAISLFLLLALCLSLCACGSGSPGRKFVGSYTSNYSWKYVIENGVEFGVKEFLVIKADGTAILTYISEATVSGTNNHVSPAHSYTIQEGDVLAEWELKWQMIDAELVLDGDGTRYYTSEIDYVEGSQNSKTVCDFGNEAFEIYTHGRYTLEDDQLCSNEKARYTKVD